MKLNEMLKRLKDSGHPLTRASLYRSGIKNGYLTREPHGATYRYVVDEKKFNEWLDNAVKKVPDGYISLTDASNRFNCSYALLRTMCKTGELKYVIIGAGSGVMYVRLDEAEIAVGIHRQNN